MFVQSPEVVAEKVLDAQVLDILLQTLCNEEADADLRLTILIVIANLTLDEKAMASISKNDTVFSALVASLQSSTNEVVVKKAVCVALQNVSASGTANKNRILGAGGVAAIVASVCAFSEDATMLESAFGLMKELLVTTNNSREDFAAKQFIADHDGKKILLSAMKEHEDTPAVQRAACGVIAYLPFEKSDEVEKDVLLAEAILLAMKNHSDSAHVHFAAVEALLELVTHLDSVRKLLLLKANANRELLLHAKSVSEACTADVDDILAIAFSNEAKDSATED